MSNKRKDKHKTKTEFKTVLQAKDTFKKIRRLQQRFTLRIRVVVFVTFILVMSFLLALGIDAVFTAIIGELWTVPPLIELALTAALICVFSTFFLSRSLITPIKNVGPAMEKISNGDYSVRIQTNSVPKEIKEIYSGFNMMAQELESSEILKSDFISTVSHEFKTPISAIEGYSMLLQDGDNLTPDQKQYVEKIIYNTKRLSSLTGSILLLSKLENQSIVVNKTEFSLDEQIRKSLLVFENEWEKKDIEFDIELDDATYVGNEALIHHIWDNLISNAIKFSDFGGKITIRLTDLDNFVIFSVKDEGIGVDDYTQKHLFDKFYQADSSHKQEGNGLGLALVKKIVDLERGTISVQNNEDKGCTFTVLLTK